MGATRVFQILSALRHGRRAAACAAVLLAAIPSPARCAEPGDTVRVEWATSADSSLLILNAYAVRGGRPVPESVHGLLIERDPAALPDSRGHRYLFTDSNTTYATAESAPFLRALGLSEGKLDTLANDGGASQKPDQFDVQEWTRLLHRLRSQDEAGIVEGTHHLLIRKVEEPVLNAEAGALNPLFSGSNPQPVFPHLKGGMLALGGREGESAVTRSIAFRSTPLGNREPAQIYLKNYGIRPVRVELSVSDTARQAGFSVEGPDTLTVSPGDSVRVPLGFIPSEVGSHGGTMDVTADGEPAAQVTFTGTGRRTGIWPLVREWVAGAVGLLLSLLAVAVTVAVAWKRRVRLGLSREHDRPSPESGRQEPDSPPPGQSARPPRGTAPDPAGVRQRLAAARQSIDDALAELGDDPVPQGGSDRAQNLRRLRELERERESCEEARSDLEGRVRTIEVERDDLAKQVSALGTVRAENATLGAEKVAADTAAAGLRENVNRLTGERRALESKLGAVAEVLELSHEMVSDAGWPETQRRLPELRDGGKPLYLQNFEQLLADLTAIFEEIAPQAGEGRLNAAVAAVLSGSNHNAGLRKVAAELERTALASGLGLAHPRDLRRIGADRFYHEFVDRRFRPVIDNIAKLGVYARSRSPELGMAQRLMREGVDPALLERALVLIETRMRMDFGVTVDTVRLFEDRFDRARHDTASHSTLRHTLPDLESSIRRLPAETIYDITSVGLRSDGLGVSVRPVVAWVTCQ